MLREERGAVEDFSGCSGFTMFSALGGYGFVHFSSSEAFGMHGFRRLNTLK